MGESNEFLVTREMIRRGLAQVGPATTSLMFPILLPFRCCIAAREARCGRCGAVGYTHGDYAAPDLRCLDCDEFLDAIAKRQLTDCHY